MNWKRLWWRPIALLLSLSFSLSHCLSHSLPLIHPVIKMLREINIHCRSILYPLQRHELFFPWGWGVALFWAHILYCIAPRNCNGIGSYAASWRWSPQITHLQNIPLSIPNPSQDITSALINYIPSAIKTGALHASLAFTVFCRCVLTILSRLSVPFRAIALSLFLWWGHRYIQ